MNSFDAELARERRCRAWQHRNLRLLTLRMAPAVADFATARNRTRRYLRALDHRLPEGVGRYFGGIAPSPRHPGLWQAHVIVCSGDLRPSLLNEVARAVDGFEVIEGRGRPAYAQLVRGEHEAAFYRGGRLFRREDLRDPEIEAMIVASVGGVRYLAQNIAQALASGACPSGARPWIESAGFHPAWSGFAEFRDFQIERWRLGAGAPVRVRPRPERPGVLSDDELSRLVPPPAASPHRSLAPLRSPSPVAVMRWATSLPQRPDQRAEWGPYGSIRRWRRLQFGPWPPGRPTKPPPPPTWTPSSDELDALLGPVRGRPEPSPPSAAPPPPNFDDPAFDLVAYLLDQEPGSLPPVEPPAPEAPPPRLGLREAPEPDPAGLDARLLDPSVPARHLRRTRPHLPRGSPPPPRPEPPSPPPPPVPRQPFDLRPLYTPPDRVWTWRVGDDGQLRQRLEGRQPISDLDAFRAIADVPVPPPDDRPPPEPEDWQRLLE